jgi:hypothetical protein
MDKLVRKYRFGAILQDSSDAGSLRAEECDMAPITAGVPLPLRRL